MLVYDPARDNFVPAYKKLVNSNSNQEVRYTADGPLTGAVIAAEPTADAPFGFWITVDRLGPSGDYKQVLRYRSTTRYGDGNALAVIDSEMPALMQKLGLWHAGMKLPVPGAACARPHLVRQEL